MSASPSDFAAAWISTLAVRAGAPQRALDVAMGRGRHTLALARNGFITYGVDIDFAAVREVMEAAAREHLKIRGWCADLTLSRLPENVFDLVVVTRYLQRDLFPSMKASLHAGGCVLYETFTTAQTRLGFGPRSPDHLLRPNELRAVFDDWDVKFYEEVDKPVALARLVAQRPLRS